MDGTDSRTAIVVHIEPKTRAGGMAGGRDAVARLAEAVGLTAAIGLTVVGDVDRQGQGGRNRGRGRSP